MTQIAKYPIDQAFVARLKANGFCLNDPDLRYPTRNDFPSRILKLAKQRGHGPAALLLGDRNGRGDPDRSRLVPWAALGLGSAGWPDDAAAHDHHAHLVWEESIPGFEPNLGFWQGLWADVMQSVQSVDLADPAWSLALLTGLLATQTIGVFQRLALLKASAARVVESQPDLFPETLNDADGDEYAVVANKPTSWRWCTDAASRQGQVRDENQDAFAVLGFGIALRVLVLCDGAGGVGGGKEAAQSAVIAITAALEARFEEHGCLVAADLDLAIAQARQQAIDADLPGVTTALLVLLDDDQMHFATLGDGAVTVIWPDGMVGPVQVPHHTLGRPSNEIGAYIGGNCTTLPRTGTLRLEPGCFVFLMSDGASDLFTLEDFAATRHKWQVLPGVADGILAHLEAARDPDSGAWLHSDNMTLAIAQLRSGGEHDTAD